MRDTWHIARAGPAVLMLAFLGACGPLTSQTDEGERSGARSIQDAAVTMRIKTAYIFNRHLNSFRINVDTDQGQVSLEGVVPTAIQKDLAGAIARSTEGVESVHNRLQVTQGKVDSPEEVDRTFSQAVLDATTTASVKMALAFGPGVTATEINVTTRWGSVTLEGTVGTRAEKELAGRIAGETDGVKQVVNELKVSS